LARAVTEEVEVFYAVLLNAQNEVLSLQEVTRGIINSTVVHPREVFRIAVVTGAASLIVLHNHPSGNSSPSEEDRTITAQLVAAGRILDIPVYDHVILAGAAHFSFAEAGLL
jgi:DNA repair protein RadC